jgi:hypothetical protein
VLVPYSVCVTACHYLLFHLAHPVGHLLRPLTQCCELLQVLVNCWRLADLQQLISPCRCNLLLVVLKCRPGWRACSLLLAKQGLHDLQWCLLVGTLERTCRSMRVLRLLVCWHTVQSAQPTALAVG